MHVHITRRLKLAQIAITGVFFANGALLASWFAHIPWVKERLDISEASLGGALLAMALGALVALQGTGRLCERFGSRRITLVALFLVAVLLPAPLRAESMTALVAILFAFGIANGALDVSMNAHGAAVEAKSGVLIMSKVHGYFSIGGLVGSAGAWFALTWGLSPHVHTGSVAAGFIVLAAGLGRWLLPATDDIMGQEVADNEADDAAARTRSRGVLLILGGLACIALLIEGAMADWSAVYLRQYHDAAHATAALGFAAFSALMAFARLMGDGLVHRFGQRWLLRGGATIAFLGFVLALSPVPTAVAVVGFAVIGLGLSNVIPLLFRASAQLPGISAGVGIARVASVGYMGMLAGPPLIGFVADWSSLRLALATVAVMITAIVAFASTDVGN